MLEQFSNTIKRIKIILVILVLLSIVFIFMFRNIINNECYSDTISKNSIIYKNGEKVYTGDAEKYELHDIKNEDYFSIEMNVAITQLQNPIIKFDNINTAYEIFVDNELVYSKGMNVKKGGTFGHIATLAPLGKVEAGQKIKLNLRVLNASAFSGIPKIVMMNCNRGYISWFRETVIFQIIANVSFILAIGIIVFICISRGIKLNMWKAFGLVIISLGTCLWILSCFQCTQILYDGYELDALVEYASHYYIGIGLDLFVIGLDEQSKKRRIFDWIIMVPKIMAVIILTVLQLNNRLYYSNVTQFLFGISIISIVNFIYGYYKAFKNDREKWDKIKYVCYFVASCIVIYFVLQAIVPALSILFIVIMPIALVVFNGTMFFETLLDVVKGYSNSIENEALRKLAYIDTLTGLPNRRAIEEFDETIKDKDNDYVIYSFDLNGLKKVNDMYGHSVGDQLLIAFSVELKKVFEQEDSFCGRQGGDEFIAICKRDNNEKIKRFKDNIVEYNDSGEKKYKIEYSVGHAFYNRGDKRIEEAIHEADENMYKMKFKFYHQNSVG